MNQYKLLRFSVVYRKALAEAVEKYPSKYPFGPEDTCQVADRMLKAVREHPIGVIYSGDGFRLTCKRLGIKQTRKDIFEFLEIEQVH